MAKYVRHTFINETSSGTINLDSLSGGFGVLVYQIDEQNVTSTARTTGITVGGQALSVRALPDADDADIKPHVELWGIDSANDATFAALTGDQTVSISGTVLNRRYFVMVADEIADLSDLNAVFDTIDGNSGGPLTQTMSAANSGDLILQFHVTDSNFSANAQWTQPTGHTQITQALSSPAGGLGLSYETLSADVTSEDYAISHDPTETDWNALLIRIKDEVSTTTGTAAVTLDDATATASGVEGKTGSVAETLSNAVPTASGKVGQTGSAAVTLEDATSAASGALRFAGTLTRTLNAATSSASGTVKSYIGTLNKTLQPAESSASGTSTEPAERDGTVAVTLDDVTVSASGVDGVNGSAAITLGTLTTVANGTVGAKPNITVDDLSPEWKSTITITPAEDLIEVPLVVAFDNGSNINRTAVTSSDVSGATLLLGADLFTSTGDLRNIALGSPVSIWLENASQGVLTQSLGVTPAVASEDISGLVAVGYDSAANLCTMFGSGAAAGDTYLTEVLTGSLSSVDGDGQFGTVSRTPNTETRTRVYNAATGIWRADIKEVTFREADETALFLDTQTPGFEFEFNATLTGDAISGGAIKRLMISTGNFLDAKSGATTTNAAFQPNRAMWRKNADLANTRIEQLYNVYATNGFNDTATLPLQFAAPGPAPSGQANEFHFGTMPADRIDLPNNSVLPFAAERGDDVLTIVSLGEMGFNGAWAPVHIVTPATLDTTYFDVSLNEWSTVKRDFLNPQGQLTSISFDLNTTAREGWALLEIGPDLGVGAFPGLLENTNMVYNTYDGALTIASDGVPTFTGAYSRMAEYEVFNGSGWDELTTYVAGTVRLRADLNTRQREGWGLIDLVAPLDSTALPDLAVGDRVVFFLDNGLFDISAAGVPAYRGDVDGQEISYEYYRNGAWTTSSYTTEPATGGTLAVTLDNAEAATTGLIGLVGVANVSPLDCVSDATGAVGGSPGTLDVTLDNATSNATGSRGVTGAAALVLGNATSAASGRIESENSLNETLGNVIAYGVGTFTQEANDGTAGVTLDPVTASASGQSIPFVGNSNSQLDNAQSSASGDIGVNGSSNNVLEFPRTNATGVARESVSGTIEATLDAVESNATAVLAERTFVANSVTEYDVDFLMYNSYHEIPFLDEPAVREGVV